MLAVAQMIDHAWAVALDRAQKAGILLAHILMSGAHGDRPVTLIGYSMGARLIFHCLLELCRHSAKGEAPLAVVSACCVCGPVILWNAGQACAADGNRAVQGHTLFGYTCSFAS